MSGEKTKEQLLEEIALLRQQIAENKKSEKKLKNIVDVLSIGIGIARDRVLQWTNKYLTQMLGYSAEELQGQNSRILYPNDEEYNRVGIIKYEQLERTGKGRIESRMRHKNGKILDVLINSNYVNEEDAKEGVIFTLMDITEQKALEYKLKLAADDWNRTFDTIPDMIIILDVHNRITRFNKAFSDKFKMQASDIIGKKCYELIHNTEMPIEQCPFELTKRDCKIHSAEIDDPNVGIPMLVTTAPIFNKEGDLIGAVHIARDITEMRQAKAEVEQRLETLERFHKVSVGRELKMKELKERIEFLEKKLLADKRNIKGEE